MCGSVVLRAMSVTIVCAVPCRAVFRAVLEALYLCSLVRVSVAVSAILVQDIFAVEHRSIGA